MIIAPLLLIMAYDTKMPNGKENFHALHDVGLFMAKLTFQAEHMGIAVHQMAGVQFEKVKTTFDLPEDYHVASAVAIGFYGGDIENLPEKLMEMEQQTNRERKSQIEFTFNGDFVNRAKLEE